MLSQYMLQGFYIVFLDSAQGESQLDRGRSEAVGETSRSEASKHSLVHERHQPAALVLLFGQWYRGAGPQ